jgi:hypothetical protein
VLPDWIFGKSTPPEQGPTANWLTLVPELVPLLQTIIWALLVLIVLYYFKDFLSQIARSLSDRVRRGASVKIGTSGFEIGALENKLQEVRPSRKNKEDGPGNSDLALFDAQTDPDLLRNPADWYSARQSVYAYQREVFLTDISVPSGEVDRSTQLTIYNIYILLRKHWTGDLSDVQKAEFYLGRWWDSLVYTETPKDGVIGLKMRAYGSILCVCRVTFTDGYKIFISHYVDLTKYNLRQRERI